MNDLVYVIGCDAGNGCGCGNVQNLARETAHLAHTFLGVRVQEIDLVPVVGRVPWVAVLAPNGVRDRFGYQSSRGEGIKWAQRTGIFEVWPWVGGVCIIPLSVCQEGSQRDEAGEGSVERTLDLLVRGFMRPLMAS